MIKYRIDRGADMNAKTHIEMAGATWDHCLTLVGLNLVLPRKAAMKLSRRVQSKLGFLEKDETIQIH
jgi:hypothetical protein